MTQKNPSPTRYKFIPTEGYEKRSVRRLQEDLGIDEAAAEAILRLRGQIVELQSQLRQLEAELEGHHASRQVRLARYREIWFEATWTDEESRE